MAHYLLYLLTRLIGKHYFMVLAFKHAYPHRKKNLFRRVVLNFSSQPINGLWNHLNGSEPTFENGNRKKKKNRANKIKVRTVCRDFVLACMGISLTLQLQSESWGLGLNVSCSLSDTVWIKSSRKRLFRSSRADSPLKLSQNYSWVPGKQSCSSGWVNL